MADRGVGAGVFEGAGELAYELRLTHRQRVNPTGDVPQKTKRRGLTPFQEELGYAVIKTSVVAPVVGTIAYAAERFAFSQLLLPVPSDCCRLGARAGRVRQNKLDETTQTDTNGQELLTKGSRSAKRRCSSLSPQLLHRPVETTINGP
jgi:hypothetical protein